MREQAMTEEMELESLKETMSESQIRDMAEIVAAEVRRREELKGSMLKPSGARPVDKSGVRNSRLGQGLPAEAVGEMYQDLNKRLAGIRQRKIEEKTAQLESLRRSVGTGASAARPKSELTGRLRSIKLPTISSKQFLVLFAVLTLGGLKIAVHTSADHKPEGNNAPLGMLGMPEGGNSEISPAESIQQRTANTAPSSSVGEIAPIAPKANGQWSESEKQVLLELDARRVELEKRREGLDRREAEIRSQSLALADRLGELKSLTMRLNQVRQERNVQYDSRMEQLANVYGSMAPNEAAPLIGRLDDQTALAILKKLPTKRMGQILSTMDADRAVRLTKSLTDGSQIGSNSLGSSQIATDSDR